MSAIRTWLVSGLVGATLLQTFTFRLSAQTIQNPGFESPSVYNPGNIYYSFAYDPGGAAWGFSGNAGIAANNSGFVFYSPPNPVPEGNQCAFLQGSQGNSSSMSQTISITPGNDNDYSVTFWASQRDVTGRDNTQSQTVTVQVDGVTVSSVTPPVGWSSYSTTPIGLFAGNHTLTFSCSAVPGDATVLVDSLGMVLALTYTFTNGDVTVTGISGNGAALIIIPDTINGLPVTSIGGRAFVGSSMTSVTIGTNVTSIESGGAFQACFGLMNITIPNGVTNIGDDAFDFCTNLTSITIPDSVTSIGSEVFYGCTSLTNITIGTNLTSIGSLDFAYCSSLTSVTIPNSVTNIGDSAFVECTSLTNITIGTNVTSIGDQAFGACTSLTGITIPNSVTNIGSDAFAVCTNLTSITIPNSVTAIGSDAFYDCTSLTGITIPNSVTSIGSSAFSDCTSLTSIKIPNSVTNIGDYTFDGCISLTNITIGTNVTSIGTYLFYDCFRLTSITIANSVTNIESDAFASCTNLAAVYFQGNAPSADSTVFFGDPVTVYYVPGTTGWGAFASYTGITPIPWPSGVQYTATPSNAPVGLAIQFTCPGIDTNSSVITNWSWNFGNGAASTNQNPSHIYTATGTFIPIVFVVDNAGTLFPASGPAITISPPPAISAISLSGTNFMMNGTNGLSGLEYLVLTSTNLMLPRNQWTPVATNTWSSNGNFSLTLTNAVNPTVPSQFYLLQIP